MEGKKIGKIVISLLTVGVTATAAYYGYKAIKKHLAKKKAAKEAIEKEEITTGTPDKNEQLND